MDTVICDSSAYQFWRIPPVVRLLTTASEADWSLRRLVSEDEVAALRNSMAERLELCRLAFSGGATWRNAGEVSKCLRDASLLLATNMEPPIDVMVGSVNGMHRSSLVRTHTWSGELVPGSVCYISDELGVTSPAFTLQQLAQRCSLTRTAMLASELCGSFSVYRPPQPIQSVLQKLISNGRNLSYEGWSPCVSPDGRMTELWRRDPLVTPADLIRFAELSDSARGRKRMLRAAELVHPGAASPFEVQVGMLLGLPRRLGGEGFADFEHNKKIELSASAKALSGRECCYGDLVWDDGLDIECQSAAHHDNARSFISDSERIVALELMGYRVLPVTYGQISDPVKYEALVDVAARMLGRRADEKSPKLAVAAENLRSELLINWSEIQFV